MPTKEELIERLAKARLAPRKPKERIRSIATETLAPGLTAPVQLTGPGLRPTTGRMERFLKACGLTPTQYTDWSGVKLSEFAGKNPGWSMRSWEILILENMGGYKDKFYLLQGLGVSVAEEAKED